MSAESAASLAFDFSSWASLRLSCSIVAWPSDNLACSFCFGHTVNLVLLPPHVGVTESLVQLPCKILLGRDLLVVVLPQAVRHVLHVSELAKEGDPLLCLPVCDHFLLVQGRCQGRLGLHHQAGVGIELLDLAEEIRVLARHSPFGCFKVTEVQVCLFDPLGQLVQGLDEGAMRFLSRGLGPSHFICCCTHVPNFICNLTTVFDNLCFHLVQLVHLFRHLGNRIRLLLLEAGKSGFVLNVALLQVFPQLCNLSLSLFVQLHLSCSCSTGLVQAVSKTFHLPSKV